MKKYPVNEDAPCWKADSFEAHDLVYMGPCEVSMPMMVMLGPGEEPSIAIPPEITAGPFTLTLHRCVDCGVGVMSDGRRNDARDPTEKEAIWLRAIETTKMHRP